MSPLHRDAAAGGHPSNLDGCPRPNQPCMGRTGATSTLLLYPSMAKSTPLQLLFFIALACPSTLAYPSTYPCPIPATGLLCHGPLAWRTPPPFVPPSKKSGSASCDRGQRHLAIKWHLCKTGSCSNFLDFLTPPSSAQPTVLPCPALFTQEHVVLQKDSGISLDFVSAHLLYVQVLCSM